MGGRQGASKVLTGSRFAGLKLRTRSNIVTVHPQTLLKWILFIAGVGTGAAISATQQTERSKAEGPSSFPWTAETLGCKKWSLVRGS
jgi:hypothetical protein